MKLARFGSKPSTAAAGQRADAWHKRYHWVRMAMPITVALLALFAYLANKADERRLHTPSTFEQSGVLDQDDWKIGDEGRTVDVWSVELAAGQVLRVTVQSKNFTPYF